MNFLRYFFIIIIFFLKIFPSYSDECKRFIDTVLEIPEPKEGLVTDGQQPRKDLGLFYYKEYDFDRNIIKIKRDKNNYPILKISFINSQISPNSSIVAINNIDLSKITDEEIIKLGLNTSAKVKTLDNKYSITAKDYDLYPFDLEFFTINAIDEIKTKEGEFKLDYSFQVSHERPDWIEAGRKIGNFSTCNIIELLESSKIYSPVTYYATELLKQIGFNQDQSFADYNQNYYENIDKTFTLSSLSGVARIKTDFDFKKFPFDKQVLNLRIRAPENIDYNLDGNWPKPYISLINSGKNVFLDLERYKNNNFLKEWKISNIEVKNELDISNEISPFDREKLVEIIFDTININITVDRNINYFIFKIIIPVFLILSIAWSVMWIPPNQVESRLTTSIVGLLSLIAYNFVFNDDLPKLSYLTSLDRYILLSYLFCAIPTFLTIYFSRLTKKDYSIALEVNKKSRLIGMIIYIISTAVIFT